MKTVRTFTPRLVPDLTRDVGLTLNVIKPVNTDPGAKLPVVVVSYVPAAP